MDTIFGGEARNPVGYCALHHGTVTVKQLKKRGCLGKQCRHLKRYEHEYWRQRELNKQRRIERKERISAI